MWLSILFLVGSRRLWESLGVMALSTSLLSPTAAPASVSLTEGIPASHAFKNDDLSCSVATWAV